MTASKGKASISISLPHPTTPLAPNTSDWSVLTKKERMLSWFFALIKMRSCIVCGERASQRCSGCGNVSYCNVAHQVNNNKIELVCDSYLPSFDINNKDDNNNNNRKSSRKSTGRRTNPPVLPAKLWKVRWAWHYFHKWKKNYQDPINENLQDLGNYLVAGRDLPPASLVLDEEVSVLGPAEQVGMSSFYQSLLTKHCFKRLIRHTGVANLSWLLLPCTRLLLQVLQRDK